ncbi:hypothetical protein HPP92_020399 [Vanilla planifolia]|uniref:GH16 domain-containing protein n=1 Tax=Vanilla planifolia TaxID=51239 RepID=A0A835PVG3_VANPL|nr:hypothetical protein HPP92_020786 [Vanilla planifolia]KAG0461923.1 hypothetical protein HPP92_020399 [Vanilla planifolia]
MALFHLLWLSSLITTAHYSNAQPSPGYYPNLRFRPVRFYHGFTNLWGPQHQWVSGDQSSVTIWLDRNSGSGFKSIRAFRNGYFAASIKLQRGYTAGVITAFYLSNNEAHPGFHDEVDMEFLGTTPGEPYTLQTNVYVRGSGDGRIIGREMKFHLWFDPTANFHSYAILWNQMELIFFVDDVPIRRYARWSAATFPRRPMWVYGSIWDASSWATDDGKVPRGLPVPALRVTPPASSPADVPPPPRRAAGRLRPPPGASASAWASAWPCVGLNAAPSSTTTAATPNATTPSPPNAGAIDSNEAKDEEDVVACYIQILNP